MTSDLSKLAIHGGAPVRREPFPIWPFFDQDEIDAVQKVLQSGRVNYWTGQECKNFESEFAASVGKAYGIALANGTVALELALYALGIGDGDEVIVPSRTFIATASCVVARGAKPVVVDIDPISGNLCPEAVSRAISERTRAIIPVHMAGWPCDMDRLNGLVQKNGIHVIEDCSQAHGATYQGRPVGSFGICSAFSFCQDKIMTTGGEGGIFLTDDPQVWRRAWEYKDHGKSWEAVFNRDHAPGFRWLHESFGTNWRMTEMQAVIGRIQLKKLSSWSQTRNENAIALADGLKEVRGIKVPMPPSDVRHAWYKFYCMLEPEKLQIGWSHQRIIEAINAEGIPCLSGSCYEIYREKAFLGSGYGPSKPLENASCMANRSLMFLVHPTLGTKEMMETIVAVGKVMEAAST